MAIENYTPEDSANTMYILESCSLQNIIYSVKNKWGDVELDEIEIESSYIHTRCLGYDLYDSSDYDNYIEVTYTPTKGGQHV